MADGHTQQNAGHTHRLNLEHYTTICCHGAKWDYPTSILSQYPRIKNLLESLNTKVWEITDWDSRTVYCMLQYFLKHDYAPFSSPQSAGGPLFPDTDANQSLAQHAYVHAIGAHYEHTGLQEKATEKFREILRKNSLVEWNLVPLLENVYNLATLAGPSLRDAIKCIPRRHLDYLVLKKHLKAIQNPSILVDICFDIIEHLSREVEMINELHKAVLGQKERMQNIPLEETNQTTLVKKEERHETVLEERQNQIWRLNAALHEEMRKHKVALGEQEARHKVTLEEQEAKHKVALEEQEAKHKTSLEETQKQIKELEETKKKHQTALEGKANNYKIALEEKDNQHQKALAVMEQKCRYSLVEMDKKHQTALEHKAKQIKMLEEARKKQGTAFGEKQKRHRIALEQQHGKHNTTLEEKEKMYQSALEETRKKYDKALEEKKKKHDNALVKKEKQRQTELKDTKQKYDNALRGKEELHQTELKDKQREHRTLIQTRDERIRELEETITRVYLPATMFFRFLAQLNSYMGTNKVPQETALEDVNEIKNPEEAITRDDHPATKPPITRKDSPAENIEVAAATGQAKT